METLPPLLLARYDNGGATAVANSLSSERGSGGGGGRDRRCTFSAIKDEGLGTAGAPSYITVRPLSACAPGHTARALRFLRA